MFLVVVIFNNGIYIINGGYNYSFILEWVNDFNIFVFLIIFNVIFVYVGYYMCNVILRNCSVVFGVYCNYFVGEEDD